MYDELFPGTVVHFFNALEGTYRELMRDEILYYAEISYLLTIPLSRHQRA